jgi:hypothetical protein
LKTPKSKNNTPNIISPHVKPPKWQEANWRLWNFKIPKQKPSKFTRKKAHVAGQWVTVPENFLDWTWRVNEGTVWPPLMENDSGSLILCWWYFLCMECMALWWRIWWGIVAPHWWALEGNSLQRANQASGRSQKRLDEWWVGP